MPMINIRFRVEVGVDVAEVRWSIVSGNVCISVVAAAMIAEASVVQIAAADAVADAEADATAVVALAVGDVCLTFGLVDMRLACSRTTRRTAASISLVPGLLCRAEAYEETARVYI
jgi:hypothetical protein